MELGVRGRAAIVCAASKGLGRAVAMGLAEEGTNVAICARGEEALRATADDIRNKTKVEVLDMPADVTRLTDVEQLVQATAQRFGRIDILVTNAGGPPPVDSFLDLRPEGWLEGLNLNLMSTINLCREVVPHMLKNAWGRIVNITSIAVKQPVNTLILSNTARAGVIGFAKTISNQLAAQNVLVNNVCPGYILTQRVERLARNQAESRGISYEEALADFATQVPLGRVGRPDEFANLVVFLASERASYITGISVQIDGGLYRGLM